MNISIVRYHPPLKLNFSLYFYNFTNHIFKYLFHRVRTINYIIEWSYKYSTCTRFFVNFFFLNVIARPCYDLQAFYQNKVTEITPKRFHENVINLFNHIIGSIYFEIEFHSVELVGFCGCQDVVFELFCSDSLNNRNRRDQWLD